MNIDKFCAATPDGECFHWASRKDDEPYTVMAYSEILAAGGRLAAHADRAPDPDGEACGNPWNILARYPDIKLRLMQARPACSRPLPVCISTEIYDDTPESRNHIRDALIGGDCHRAFVRDATSHKIVDDCYNLDIGDKGQEQAARQRLQEGLSAALDETFRYDRELCLKLGHAKDPPFVEYVIRKGGPGQFIVIEVRHYRSAWE